MDSNARPIARFALASALVHLGLLVGLHSPPRPVLSEPDEGLLSVQLTFPDAAPAARAEDPPRHTARRKPTRRASDAPREDATAAERAQALREAEMGAAPADDTRATGPAAEAAEEDAAPAPLPRAWIRARLEADVARHFDYPYLARLRGWEGTVWLAFRLEADGRLEAVRLARSSGFAALDVAALHSLERVERLPQAVAWLQGHPLDMELPVIYRLVGVR